MPASNIINPVAAVVGGVHLSARAVLGLTRHGPLPAPACGFLRLLCKSTTFRIIKNGQ